MSALNCPECKGPLVSGEDQFADSWICSKCNKAFSWDYLRKPCCAASIKVVLHGVVNSYVGLEEREAEVLMARASQQEVSAARTLLHALRVFDLYLAGKLKAVPSEMPGCGVIE